MNKSRRSDLKLLTLEVGDWETRVKIMILANSSPNSRRTPQDSNFFFSSGRRLSFFETWREVREDEVI